MNHQQLYQQCHSILWAYRTRLSEVWPTPPVEDALRFAVTEAAEVIDAELRLNPTYARNNDKDLEPLDEVADCLMMLITAAGRRDYRGNRQYGPVNSANLAHFCCMALDDVLTSRTTTLNTIFWCCDMAMSMLGEDAPRRLEQRLKRIEAKVMG